MSLLEVAGVTVRFGGHVALQDVGFAAEAGQIGDGVAAVLGPRAVLEQVEAPLDVVLAEGFLHDEVGGAGVELDGGGGRHRTERVVERHRDVGGVGDRGVATPAGSLVYVDEQEAIYLQTAPDRIARIPNKDGYNAVTNHVVVDEMRPHFAEGTAYSEGSVNRLNTVTHFVKHFFGRIDPQSAATILSSHYDFANGREKVFAQTPCQPGAYRGSASGTNLSTIVKLEEDTVWLALGNPCVGTYTRIRIGSREEIDAAATAAIQRITATSSPQ